MSNEIVEKSVESQLTSDYAQLSQWIKDTAANTGSFLNEQTPLFIQEYLAWEFWGSLIQAILSLIALIATIYSGRKLFLWAQKRLEEDYTDVPAQFGYVFGGMTLLGIMAICLVNFYTNSVSAAKVAIAPRVVITEKIGSLLK